MIDNIKKIWLAKFVCFGILIIIYKADSPKAGILNN